MRVDSNSDPIPKAVREVIELYEARAGALCFPDMDAQALREQQDEVQQAGAAVDQAQAALTAARAAHRQREEALLAMARRAFAYARIFAETDPELAAALDRFALANPERQERKARTPGRKKKTARVSDKEQAETSADELPFDRERRAALS